MMMQNGGRNHTIRKIQDENRGEFASFLCLRFWERIFYNQQLLAFKKAFEIAPNMDQKCRKIAKNKERQKMSVKCQFCANNC